MIKISNIQVFNFDGAFRGMRNPKNSWDRSDSQFGIIRDKYIVEIADEVADTYSIEQDFNKEEKVNFLLYNGYGPYLPLGTDCSTYAFIGEKDLTLAQALIIGGPVHSKFMRQILVSMDIEAPLFWWKEMDTYKVGTVANSCSTMHKLASTPITSSCFSFSSEIDSESQIYPSIKNTLINDLENIRQKYLETKDERYWKLLVELLPESWNQKRTWTANYEILRNIYTWRRNHKLTEWRDFCRRIEELPYAKELICYNIKGE